MYYILPFFLFVSVVITNFFYFVSSSSIDGAIDSISKSTFTQNVFLLVPEDEVDSVDDFYIDKQGFESVYMEQFEANLGYFDGEIEVSFAYYNVKDYEECNETLVCNGVQVRIRVTNSSLLMLQNKYIRYEVNQIGN